MGLLHIPKRQEGGMTKCIMVSEKKWHDESFERLMQIPETVWIRIDHKAQFESNVLEEYDPDFIFSCIGHT